MLARAFLFFEGGPGSIYLYILVVGVVSTHDRTYAGIQSWSILLLFVRMAPNFGPSVPRVTQIAHVNGEEEGGVEQHKNK